MLPGACSPPPFRGGPNRWAAVRLPLASPLRLCESFSAPWHSFNRKGWAVAYSLGRDRWIWIPLGRRRTQTRVPPLLRRVLQLSHYTKTTAPIICILNSSARLRAEALARGAGLAPLAGFGALRSVGAAHGMRRESPYGDGTWVPGARAKISTENPRDKCQGGNEVLQTSPLKITRDTSGPTIQRPDLLLQG